jgi:hypothetical protein
MSVYFYDKRGNMEAFGCFASIYRAVSGAPDPADADDDDDYDYESEMDYYEDAVRACSALVAFAGADRRSIVPRVPAERLPATVAAYQELVAWFFSTHTPSFIDPTPILELDDVVYTMFTSDNAPEGGIPVDLKAAADADTSYLPLGLHLLRLPYTRPDVPLVWKTMVSAGMTAADALRLACATQYVGTGDPYSGAGIVARTRYNLDCGYPFSGQWFATMGSSETFSPVAHVYNDMHDLSTGSTEGIKRNVVTAHTDLQLLYKASPKLAKRYGKNPKWSDGWRSQDGIDAVATQEQNPALSMPMLCAGPDKPHTLATLVAALKESAV